ncbi:DUF2264 domain-containing protein [Sediminibacterium roseum]|uniref:DUF2264 domain-containing protein n=1 Tax=Sediminibacterium roseum TaxID=1978412 RepID=A0ABW9ZXU0_9BACT|nr:DUF2264 domain-containing protein [Sediminibacterium roseum]NCI49671.1 DUF2264 domain-containing protein [Sediminibacterium roseum]
MRSKFFLLALVISFAAVAQNDEGQKERAYLVQAMTKLADPMFKALSEKTLKEKMPVEKSPEMIRVKRIPSTTYLEGFGRMMAGMAPWLELGADDTEEGKLRKKYIDLALLCIKNGVDSTSPDYLGFNIPGQSLVDAAFLTHALLRAPTQLLAKLDEKTKQELVAALKLTRKTKPYESNWLLFTGMVETGLLLLTGECNQAAIDYSIQKHKEWYKGDGAYGDGPEFHWDYYNSFVIHPMLLDILGVMKQKGIATAIDYNTELRRSRRYAAVLERLISPEGTYPVIGRSLAYRFGAFQSLSQVALMKQLPEGIAPQQVRAALYTMIKKQLEAPGTFDADGWLQIGVSGHQKDIGENYISTGSLYLCSEAFLILGLPASDALWNGKDEDWTTKKVWKGLPVHADHAIGN